MSEFDPTQPAVLHDKTSGKMIPWTGEHADHFRFACRQREDGVEWGDMLFDGWGNPLGG
jgi:hypothetical protein